MTRSERFDQYDFRDMFADARSVAIVGNAATVLEFSNGPHIDGHDIVVRFNRAQVGGVEDKLGRRTDILVANENNSLAIAPSPADTLKPRAVVSFTMRGPEFDITPFRAWVGDSVATLCCPPPDIIGFPQPGRTRLLTQGTYALYFLTSMLTIDKLFITGFTMFGAGPGGSQKYYEPKWHRRDIGTYHDLDIEPELFCAMLASFKGDLEMTAEVAGLLERRGYRRSAGTTGADWQRGTGAGWSTALRARLAYRLIRWGTRLRRSVEASDRAQFDGIRR
jgi:hypothetical protein